MSTKVSGNIVDVLNREIYGGTLITDDKSGKIKAIIKDNQTYARYIIPGFVDAHVHIESSMIHPIEFGRAMLSCGTVGTVSDPHEIANVLGIDGVRYMMSLAEKSPCKLYFSAPSCVPASPFETAGGTISVSDVETLMKHPMIKSLGEVMNFPGVINKDKEVLAKIKATTKVGKIVDGHAPSLRGSALEKYIAEGVQTDHESVEFDEGLEKIKLGMRVIIREGSAARNFDVLIPLIKENSDMLMFCSDDTHPDQTEKGNVNNMVKRAVALGYDVFDVLKVACVNPVLFYNLEIGILRKGDFADFVIVDNLKNFEIIETFINGQRVHKKGQVSKQKEEVEIVNNFHAKMKKLSDLRFLLPNPNQDVDIIEALDGSLLTKRSKTYLKPDEKTGNVVSDKSKDVLKMVVINRYNGIIEKEKKRIKAIAFTKNFGIKKGAIASSVAHDSHNIIAVGTTDEEILKAVNIVIQNKGGVCYYHKKEGNEKNQMCLRLPICGLMSDLPYEEVARQYTEIDNYVKKEMGATLTSPYMTLSFMALLDMGLFDGENFKLIKWSDSTDKFDNFPEKKL